MTSAVDLRRVIFPTATVTVNEHGAETLKLSTGQWLLSAYAVDSDRAGNIRSALQGVAARSRECRQDVLRAPGAPTLYRWLRGAVEPWRATQADYMVSFPDGWIIAGAFPRTPGEWIDVTPIDEILLAFRLADSPRWEAEVPPAWRAYQRSRPPGAPAGKFVLSMPPAPVRLGNFERGRYDTTILTEAEFRRGGRRVAPDLIEFYVRDDPAAIRVDLWRDSQPHVAGRESIFEATLRVEQPTTSIWSLDKSYDAPIPPGDYEASVTLVNRGQSTERFLTDNEWFDRDDLERYEVLLRRSAAGSGGVAVGP